jgi:hypothetical protein
MQFFIDAFVDEMLTFNMKNEIYLCKSKIRKYAKPPKWGPPEGRAPGERHFHRVSRII